MANHKLLAPFILQAEGGYVNDPLDAGGETNKGITYSVWKTVFGDDHPRFIAMLDEDWKTVFKKLYWDAILGDQITSQRIADIICDWVWGSGKYYPETDIQDILIHVFSEQITEDGNFGQHTIDAINEVDEFQLYNTILQKRMWYLNQIVIAHPTNQRFLQGWKNRMTNLVAFDKVNS